MRLLPNGPEGADFPDEELRTAARAVLASGFVLPEPEEHTFSENFLSHMRELLRTDRRRVRARRFLQRAAVIFLCIVMAGALLAIADPQVRAVFSKVLKREYEDRTEYVYSRSSPADGSHGFYRRDIPEIEFGWLPGGCEIEVLQKDGAAMTAIAYNDKGTVFVFCCTSTDLRGGTSISTDGVPIRRQPASVSGREADFFEGVDGADSNKLVWTSEDEGLLFILDSSLPKEDMIRVAENIVLK